MQITNDIKIFGGIILATVALIVGAIFIFGKDSATIAPSDSIKPVKVSSDILAHEDSWSEGTPSAKVTVVEFGDYECPACKAEEIIVKQARNDYKDKVRFVWRQFPLTQIHKFAFDSALAAEAAGMQGKFWQYHDKLFEISPELQAEKLTQIAKDLELDLDKFNSDKNSDEARQRVLNDQADGNKAKVTGTPTIFINGTLLVNHADPRSLPRLEDFKQEIDSLLK